MKCISKLLGVCCSCTFVFVSIVNAQELAENPPPSPTENIIQEDENKIDKNAADIMYQRPPRHRENMVKKLEERLKSLEERVAKLEKQTSVR